MRSKNAFFIICIALFLAFAAVSLFPPRIWFPLRVIDKRCVAVNASWQFKDPLREKSAQYAIAMLGKLQQPFAALDLLVLPAGTAGIHCVQKSDKHRPASAIDPQISALITGQTLFLPDGRVHTSSDVESFDANCSPADIFRRVEEADIYEDKQTQKKFVVYESHDPKCVLLVALDELRVVRCDSVQSGKIVIK